MFLKSLKIADLRTPPPQSAGRMPGIRPRRYETTKTRLRAAGCAPNTPDRGFMCGGSCGELSKTWRNHKLYSKRASLPKV